MQPKANSEHRHGALIGFSEYTNYTDFNVCRLNECPAYGTLRNGASFSKTSAARVITTRLSSMATWNPGPDLNLKSTLGSEWTFVGSDNASATGLGLPPGMF